LKNKRGFTFTSMLLVVIIFLAACSNGGTNAGKEENAGSKTESIKLTMWGGVPPESGPQAVVDSWNADNPDIQVEYIRFVNDDDGNLKLDTALLTGQNVDLYVGYDLTRLTNRIESGVALDLGEFNDYNIEENIGPDANAWKVNDKFYGIPTKKSVTFVALNKDALDAAGLPVPKAWTWDEMREYAIKLKADNRYGLVQHLESFSNPMDSVLSKEGYLKADGSSNMAHPAIKKFLETLNAMMKEDLSSPPLGEQITSKMPVENVFLSGEAAMLNIGEWLIRSSNNLAEFPRDFKIAFAPVPRLLENESDYITNGGLGDMVTINAKTKHKEAAWKFLKWYTDGGMSPMAAGGRLPASQAVDQEVALKSLLGDNADTYDVESLKFVLFEDKTPTFVRSIPQEVADMRKTEYEKYFISGQNADEALANMVKQHDKYMSQNK
jgi:multiple sugar transport system substrate-binding protein